MSSVLKPDMSPPASGKSGITGFDPEGLERAAKAARELDASKNASHAIELIKAQEATKQHEAAAKRAEMDAYAQQMRAQNIEREADEARKTLDAQTQHDKARAEYRDELERRRQVDMLNAQKYMQEEQLKKQEEMVARQEAMRRKTAELEAELRTKTELAKATAEAEGRIRQERENHDLILSKLRLEATERRETVLKAVKEGLDEVGKGLSTYLDDREKLRNTALTVTGVALGIYTAKMGTGIAGRFIEVRIDIYIVHYFWMHAYILFLMCNFFFSELNHFPHINLGKIRQAKFSSRDVSCFGRGFVSSTTNFDAKAYWIGVQGRRCSFWNCFGEQFGVSAT